MTPRRKTARTRRERAAPKETHFNALLVFLMFLYMLRLVDKKTLKRVQRDLSPQKKKHAAKRRTKRTAKGRRRRRK